MSDRVLPTTKEGPGRVGAAARVEAVNSEPAAAAINSAAEHALALRDQALAALDEGDPWAALAIAGEGLAALDVAGLEGGADAAALLVTVAEIEESAGRFGDATVTIAAAIAILEDSAAEGGDDDTLLLWCQAQERPAGGRRAVQRTRCHGLHHRLSRRPGRRRVGARRRLGDRPFRCDGPGLRPGRRRRPPPGPPSTARRQSDRRTGRLIHQEPVLQFVRRSATSRPYAHSTGVAGIFPHSAHEPS